MKKISLSVAFFSLFLIFSRVEAQPGVHVHVNVGLQPAWVPAGNGQVDYYYLPDIQAYYYVPQRQFIYQEDGRWVFAASLPYRWHSYNLYRGPKVVVRGPRPYLRDHVYRENHGRYRNYPDHRGHRAYRGHR